MKKDTTQKNKTLKAKDNKHSRLQQDLQIFPFCTFYSVIQYSDD